MRKNPGLRICTATNHGSAMRREQKDARDPKGIADDVRISCHQRKQCDYSARKNDRYRAFGQYGQGKQCSKRSPDKFSAKSPTTRTRRALPA